MASLRSLGAHTPSALPYLIAESVLPEDASEDLYKWETSYDRDSGEEVEDELLTTDYCVVWSRGGTVRKVFNFEVEQQKVVQAVLTWFKEEEPARRATAGGDATKSITSGWGPGTAADSKSKIRGGTKGNHGEDNSSHGNRARALVVFLKFQAHVFFLSGASHVVNLPFEVERAFPAPRGLLIQRKLPVVDGSPATPILPPAPPNSFLSQGLSQTFSQPFAPSPSSQSRPSSSYRGLRRSKAFRRETASTNAFDDILKGANVPTSDGLPRLFSFTDPLSELGLVVHAESTVNRSVSRSIGLPERKLDPVAKAEEVIYVSAGDEITDECNPNRPLILVVTANHQTNAWSIWYAAYINSKPLSSSADRRLSLLPINKVRRRSSYGPTPGSVTGSTTPALRSRDGVRESFSGVRGKTGPGSQNKDPNDRQAEEDAFASQLDPDYALSQPAKESRRVSSLLSRADLSTSYDKTAFQDLATHHSSFGSQSRRGHSFGGHTDRSSFLSLEKSRLRASTPGSMSRLSIGGASVDETLEDIMDEDDDYAPLNDYDILDDLLSGEYGETPESGLQEPLDGLRKEFVMIKISEIPIGDRPIDYSFSGTSSAGSPSVFTLLAPFTYGKPDRTARSLYIHIINKPSKEHVQIELSIQQRRVSKQASARLQGIKAPTEYQFVPIAARIQRLKGYIGALKMTDHNVDRLLCLTQEDDGDYSLTIRCGWGPQLPMRVTLGALRLFNPYSAGSGSPVARRVAGLRRTLSAPRTLEELAHAGPGGCFDAVDDEGRRHRIQIHISPRNELVAKILDVCQYVLPQYGGEIIRTVWWNMHEMLQQPQTPTSEWIAIGATLFTLAVPYIDTNTHRLTESEPPRRLRQRKSSGLAQCGTQTTENPWDAMWSFENTVVTSKGWNRAPWAWAGRHRLAPLVAGTQGRWSASRTSGGPVDEKASAKASLIASCASLARKFNNSVVGIATNDQWSRLATQQQKDVRILYLAHILVAVHLLYEESKLDVHLRDAPSSRVNNLPPLLAQLGHWLSWNAWGWQAGGYYDIHGATQERWEFEDSRIKSDELPSPPFDVPPSVYEWMRNAINPDTFRQFPTLDIMVSERNGTPYSAKYLKRRVSSLTPRTVGIANFYRKVNLEASSPTTAVEVMAQCGINRLVLETLPEAALAPLKEAILRCQANPPTTWANDLLELIGREDLKLLSSREREWIRDIHPIRASQSTAIRDMRTVCQTAEQFSELESTSEADRYTITRLIFNEDQRFLEATKLVEPLRQAVAECHPQPGWTEVEYLDHQKEVVQWAMVRHWALPSGNAMVRFNSKRPLITEAYPLHGFTTSCLMKPLNNVLTADRQQMSEEKQGWAFFHAGVSAGLSISRDAQGIDTSWIMFNKPAELTNKHAGLLLGLGLNGHLKTIAKWLSFKYLTPKHTMTSVGLLLGLAASFMGTMDTLVTRLLSVHVTRMLPQGAAELNLSPLTQTTGLMGIGLLYYNTQHRRMSEIMLSEIEHVDHPDPSEPPDTLREEGYRLAAGFALGYINLGKGGDLRGLHDMRIVERLLAVAVGPKPVDIVHIMDQATAGATIAIALIFMKTENHAVARKIDVPDTLPQFDYVRPDIFLLRTLAKHLILWSGIEASPDWMMKNLPAEYRKSKYALEKIRSLRSEHMPYYNVIAGLLWSIALRYAGSGNTEVKEFLIQYLDQFMRICRLPALRYDARLTRNTVRNCQDLIALATATVMAGTGDLDVFRRLRALHGRIGPDVPYGSHLAAHMALGALFMAGGTYTFSTSNLALASLICAFYPHFPTEVHDNRAHLQAFRHFWVLAAEPRCLVIRDVDTQRPLSVPVTVALKPTLDPKSKARPPTPQKISLRTPTLLPPLDSIATITTHSAAHWPVTIDFASNPSHLDTFIANKLTLLLRRRPAASAHDSIFSGTLAALNETATTRNRPRSAGGATAGGTVAAFSSSSSTAALSAPDFDSLLELPAFREFGHADTALVLPREEAGGLGAETGAVEHRLLLRKEAKEGVEAEGLLDLKGVLEWSDWLNARGVEGRWLRREVVEGLKGQVEERAAAAAAAAAAARIEEDET